MSAPITASEREPEYSDDLAAEDPQLDFSGTRDFRRSKPAGSAAIGWMVLLPALLFGSVFLIVWLGTVGGRAVLESEESFSLAERIKDPEAPGYVAFVLPSPTAFVMLLDAAEQPVGGALLAVAGERGGGTVVVTPAELVLPFPDGAQSLARAWEEGGRDLVEVGISELFGVVVDDVLVQRPADLALAAAEAVPFTISFLDPVVSVAPDGSRITVAPEGVVSVEADDLGPLMAALDSGEVGVNRADRQVKVWREMLAAAPAPTEVLEREQSLEWYLAELARARVSVQLVPLVAADQVGFYEPDAPQIEALIETAVPFPTLYRESRPTVRLLNGVGDPALNERAAESISAGGGLLAVIGNPAQFGVETTIIEVTDLDVRPVAERIAEQLGGALVVDALEAEDDTAIRITLGEDYAQRDS
ncbi:MAG: LytR C-terminal domain-containing protein [Acidimicrobiales bacterium]|nr:LytR C-terminal domain-containing protein [Acidimicrobiales bacterium]